MKNLKTVLINLTPHNIDILDANNVCILKLKSDWVVRIATQTKPVDTICGKFCHDCQLAVGAVGCGCYDNSDNWDTVNIPITKTSFLSGDLPDKKDGYKYIVSLPVAQYAKSIGRTDFLIPGDVVRDWSKILGCKSLAVV